MSEIYDKAVGVRFGRVSRIYHFDANGYNLEIGDAVIVETIRGRQIGTVATVMNEFVNEGEPLKPVDHPATPRELVARELNNQNNEEVLTYAQNKLKELKIDNAKILSVEFSYDGSRLLVNYSSDNDEKVDLKALKYDLQKQYNTVSVIDLRQLGPRDVAKSLNGMGACGLASRCCSRYLTEFSSISIKMAKEQGISLTPAEITGMCGRLRCCLIYENDYYVECRKRLPKKNKRVITPNGEGKIIEVFPLREAVLVEIPEVGRREYKADQITLVDTPPNKDQPRKDKGKDKNHAQNPEPESEDNDGEE